MSKGEVLAELSRAIEALDVEKARGAAEKAVGMKVAASEIVNQGLVLSLKEVGNKYESGEYFLSDLLMATECAKAVMQVIKPHLQVQKTSQSGKIVLGTVEGDLHDIGKNILACMAEAFGFEVHDLGVDVQSRVFAEKVRTLHADVLGMSSLLSTTAPKFKETVDALKNEKGREHVKVIIGGVSASQKLADESGADAYEPDAMAGARKINEWLRKQDI